VIGLSLLLALASPPAPNELPRVEVTAAAGTTGLATLPGSASVVRSERFGLAQPRIDVSEALARVPGLVANNRRNYAQDLQLVVRGYGARATFGVRGVKLYVNGIPASSADGQGQLANAALVHADRIEVLRGPVAALYGNASGGVVRVESDPATAGRGASGSFADDYWKAAAHGALAWTDGAASGALEHFHNEGHRPHSAARRDVVDAVASGDFGGGWRWRAMANALRTPEAEDPLGITQAELDAGVLTTPAALAFDTRKSVEQRQAGFAVERNGFRAAAYAGARDVVQYLSVPVAAQSAPTSAGGVIDLGRDYAGVELRASRDVGPLLLSVGATIDEVVERRRGYENFVGTTLGVRGALRRDEHNRARALDALLQAEWRFADDWLAVAAVRRATLDVRSDDDYVAPGNGDDGGERDFDAWVPYAGLTWTPLPSLSVHAAWARGFEAPTINELAYRPDGSSGLNLALDPMRSTQAELGARWSRERTALEATAFRDRTQDEIVVARNSGGRSAFTNAGRTRRRGVELALDHAWNERWAASLAWTWVDARYDDAFAICRAAPCTEPDTIVAKDSRLPGVPAHGVFAELAWRPTAAWRAALEWRHAGSVVVDDANSARARDWDTMAIAAERRWRAGGGELALGLRIDNLADRDYVGSVIVNEANARYFEPAPGRTFVATLSWEGVPR
jgi:iron complex outermembrane receptor protein